jgi:hypothetical protein
MKSTHKSSKGTQKDRMALVPLEVIFCPDVYGSYDLESGHELDVHGQRYNPLHAGFVPAFIGYDFITSGDFDRGKTEDPWAVRNEWFWFDDEGCKNDPHGMTMVFGQFGRSNADLLIPCRKFPENQSTWSVSMALKEEYDEWRELIRAAMGMKMTNWPQLVHTFPAHKVGVLCSPTPLLIAWRDGKPAGIIHCSCFIEAIIATLQVDAVVGAKWGFCASETCGKSFLKSRKVHLFCGIDCKHRQNVRNARSRAQDTDSADPKGTEI